MLTPAVLVLVVGEVVATPYPSATIPLAFKSCNDVSSIQRCKVKAVEVSGCNAARSHAWNKSLRDRNGLSSRPADPYECEVSKNSQLYFRISVHSGFTSDKLSSKFSVLDYPGSECSPLARRLGQCQPRRSDCSPASKTNTTCLFREYVRSACRKQWCPLTPRSVQKVTDYLKVNPDSDDIADEKDSFKVQWKLWSKVDKKDNCCFTFALKYY